MQLSQALNPRRIARSLVVILTLTLIETIVAPVIAPVVSVPKAEAVTGTITPSTHALGSTLTIPYGVTSITIEAVGGSGGKGGNDGNVGTSGTVAGRIIATYAVSAGDVVGFYGGNYGSDGSNGVTSSGGGAGGADTFPANAYSINGTYYADMNFAGGTGGNAGGAGNSGAGGGAGAASIATINHEIVVIAAGAGGGGGAGNGGATAETWTGTISYNGSLFNGASGTSVGVCTGSNGNADGGGGGGGGGGYYGGAGGLAPFKVSECSGFQGSPGGNYKKLGASSFTDDRVSVANQTAGYVKYTYTVAATTACEQTSTTVDIYTVLTISQVGSCTWAVPSTVNVIDFFMVGGGGGGGGDGGSGGGGGAAQSRTAVPVSPNTNLTLTIGNGGIGGKWGGFTTVAGSASTIVTAGGTTYTANGGSAGNDAPSAVAAAGGTATNGGFAGGAGGIGPACSNTMGGAGKTGISNYFLGTQNTYGGGGGGGTCPNNAAVTAAAGANGGGAGGYSVYSNSVYVNFPGSDGTPGTGGGGGGGIATGSGLKVNGGKGGSGVILIRYATNAADAFPVSVSSALAARFSPGDLQLLDSSRRGWIDSSGSNASIASANIVGSPTISTRGPMDGANATDSTKNIFVVKGSPSETIKLVDLPTNYTLFHIARYVTGGANKRIITESGGNWFSGHYAGDNGCVVHYEWLTSAACNTGNVYGWQLDMDQLMYYRHNGQDVTMNRDANNGNNFYWLNYQTNYTGFGINQYSTQKSDFEVAEVLIFNRKLTAGEIRGVENWLARVNGLTLHANYTSSETDTAGVFNGTNYYYGQYDYGMAVNDTFTLESWVKPASYCGYGGGSECPIFSYENVLVTRIYNGTFWYALYGSVSGWSWTDTGVKFEPSEWHHIAFSKRLPGNKANAIDLYKDGQLAYTNRGSPYLNSEVPATRTSSSSFTAASGSATDIVYSYDTWWYIGARSGTPRYYGSIDEFKLWNVARTSSDIFSDMTSNSATSPNLRLYFDFNRDALSGTYDLQNLGWGGQSRSDMVAAGTQNFEDVKTVAADGPYTEITFPRTYITQNGGWKVPAGINRIQTAVIGGGGGGGGGYEGGGGGAGGFIETLTTLSPGNTYPIKVGVGGRGVIDTVTPTNGDSTTAFGFAALGGGAGAYEFYGSQAPAASGGSGGGGSWGNVLTGGLGTSGQGSNGGDSSNLSGCATPTYAGAGGGGAGGVGVSPGCTKGGNGGLGVPSTVIGSYVAAGGGGSARATTITSAAQGIGGSSIGGNSAYTSKAFVGASGGATNGKYGTGSGGGAGYSVDATLANGGAGGSGVVAIRYITALVPAYTKPSNVTLDVGQTETFTTNVAQDSATAVFTRTFKWESTTPTSGGTYTTLKVGTGAANAAYGWVPSDTSTTGSGYLYRLTVTDSDTSGLFITDSSTAWATINPAMVITKTSASNSLVKKINISRTETFTITLGTPTYRATLSPVLQGITIDTSTAGIVILKIGDTATVGTWAETLTVTDSVSAVYNIPLSITVADPPNLLSTSEIVKNGLILNLEAGNSQSLLLEDTTTATNAVWKDLSGNQLNAQTSGTYDARTCVAPTYYASYGGYLEFDGVSSCYRAPDVGMSVNKSFSVEAWFRMNSTSWGGSTALVSQNWPSANNINIVLGGLNGTTNLRVGFYNGGWYYVDTGYTPIKGRWTHVIGTYDGASLQLWIDGSRNDSKTVTAGLTGGINNNGYSIGKSWAGGNFFNGSIAAVRIYNRALSAAEISQNYNATKSRFDSSNQNFIKPTKKYGVLTLESFTATSGQDTKTVTFAVGDRPGIDWDTTTVTNQVNLSVQESLTVGTYYDTATVTDSLGQSTYLPITFKVTQADTLTVQVRNPVTTVYTGTAPTSLPTVTISGLVGVDTATTSRLYSSAGSGLSCATGGSCAIGDIGPGGGKVFYDAGSTQSWGRYLEAAPSTWAGAADSVTANIKAWCTVAGVAMLDSADIGSLPNGIGQGKANTYTSTLNSCDGGAIYLARQYRGGGKSDWYIPTGDELVLMAANTSPNYIRTSLGLIYSASLYGYWGSNINVSGTVGSLVTVGQAWSIGATNRNDSTHNMVRPIRAITPSNASYIYPALVNDTNTPIDVETYTVSAATLNFGVGLATNYYNVVYETSTLKITPAYQNKISINLYGAIAGESFTVIASGGSGVGVVSESVTAGGNATGCTVSNHVLWNLNSKTDQKYCRIIVTKAASRNYFSDSITADVYFMAYLNGQPTGLMGSGATIALNGETAFSIDTTAPPTITGLSATTISLSAGGTFQITGTGFDLGGLRVKFNRNKYVVFVAGASTIDINVSDIASKGATSGRIAVMTNNGEAISRDFVTITP